MPKDAKLVIHMDVFDAWIDEVSGRAFMLTEFLGKLWLFESYLEDV